MAARRVTARPHGLNAPLVVSLTSYPARFATLAWTLKALLRQSVKADRTILWLTEGDDRLLPPEVLALRSEGLEIRTEAEPIRVYTKSVPALRAFADAWLVTADDDMYYGPDWLAGLVALGAPGRVVAHRAHRVKWRGTALAPYSDWDKNIAGAVEGPGIFGTGVGGVLYPPGALHPDATRAELFTRLCPGADDIWMWWMARLAGSVVRHVGPPVRIVEWPGSQAQSLRAVNHGAEAGNDRAIAAMTAQYGVPSEGAETR
ncbi:glycosyltransferase family 2 protein [Paenirhodobacter sp.]|uniref:glycosyltransferase family 2 protein n=1 Tax=Paenirhodobacter sp. TaxID=1965326 RepID=UPI003B504B0B